MSAVKYPNSESLRRFPEEQARFARSYQGDDQPIQAFRGRPDGSVRGAG